MNDTYLPNLAWTQQPSAFDLLARDEINEDQPDFERIGLTMDTRNLNFEKLKEYWRTFINGLRGYRKDKVLFEREAIWLPLFELHVPPGGKATFSYKHDASQNTGPELKILGNGFGNTISTKLSESITFDASHFGKCLKVKMLATAIRYFDTNGQTLIRLDSEVSERQKEIKLFDLSPNERPDDLSDSFHWMIVRQFDLTALHDEGLFKWQMENTYQSSWKANAGLPIPEVVDVNLGWTLELENSEGFEIVYEMPYGQAYSFYHEAGDTPLLPYCALTYKGHRLPRQTSL